MKSLLRVCTLLIAVAGMSLAAEKADKGKKIEWMTDFPAAQAKAKAENKTILMNFTGSDWCPWCIKLDKEVFSTPAFSDYATKNLVLVECDFPHEKRVRLSIEKQNKKLAEVYGAGGFPTVVLADAEGKKLGATGYIAGGADKWLANLQRIVPAKK